MARPRKYHTDQQRKAAIRRHTTPVLRSKFFRLVIPDLKSFTNSEDLKKLKGDTLYLLKQHQKDLEFYKIAAETHPTTNVPHLDILLLYKRSVQKSLNRFDFLVKHGNLSRFKKLNEAILGYGDKEDKIPLTNMPSNLSYMLTSKHLEADPYAVLQAQMLKDPFHFNAHQWINSNNLAKSFSKTNWTKVTSLLKLQQEAECYKILHNKCGFKFINKKLIKNILPVRAYHRYYANRVIYDKIIEKINEIFLYSFKRPFKTKQLLLVSPPNSGKTSLALKIKEMISVYNMGVSNWFPAYKSNVYEMILWDEFNLNLMPYTDLLKFLQGLQMDLQYKGGSVLKSDNQLIFMTSNMNLTEHINSRFKNIDSRNHAESNLRARIEQIIIPPEIDLFLLQKLIQPNLDSKANNSL